MTIYEFSFDHKRIKLFTDKQKCRDYAAEWLFYNYKYRTEARVWVSDIVSGRFSEFDLASGGHFAIRELEVCDAV